MARRHVTGAFLRTAALPAALVLLSSGWLAAQGADTAIGSAHGRRTDQRPAEPEPTLSLLPGGPFSTMHMLLEKTVFSVDVLTLDVRIDRAVASGLADALAGIERDDRAYAAAVAEAALGADELIGRIEFQRGISLRQFLDAVNTDMRKTVDVGWLHPSRYREVRDGLPIWFSFLAQRGIREGDRLSYHVRGDTLRTVFASADGEILLDQTDVGRHHVMAVVGTWFAPRSSFREKLIRSLFDGERP